MSGMIYGLGLRTFAGFWKRALASIIDSFIIIFICFMVGFFVGVWIIPWLGEDAWAAVSTLVSWFISFIINWLYFTLQESSEFKATFGKRALGIVVTNYTGERITFGQANARYWGKILSGFIFCVGYLMAAFTEKKQALHDILAKTYVVNK